MYVTDIQENNNVVAVPRYFQKIWNGITTSSYGLIFVIFVYLIFYLFYTAIRVHDFNIENYGFGGKKWLFFMGEIFIFALLNSLPFYFIAENRDNQPDPSKKSKNKKTNLIETALLFVKFAILHILLQASGWYKHELGW
jgi:heme/copper-type cytochrome/quinol oxidase subunit 2